MKRRPRPSPRSAKYTAPKSSSPNKLSGLTNNGALIACMTCSLPQRVFPAKKEAMTECGELWKKRPSLHLQDLQGTARMPALQQKLVVSRLRETPQVHGLRRRQGAPFMLFPE